MGAARSFSECRCVMVWSAGFCTKPTRRLLISSIPLAYWEMSRAGPRSRTTTFNPVRVATSLAMTRPLHPLPMTTTSVALRRFKIGILSAALSTSIDVAPSTVRAESAQLYRAARTLDWIFHQEKSNLPDVDLAQVCWFCSKRCRPMARPGHSWSLTVTPGHSRSQRSFRHSRFDPIPYASATWRASDKSRTQPVFLAGWITR